jgi:hypothetical protein
MYSKISIPDTVLYFISGYHVQYAVLKLLLAYTVRDAVPLSGEELGITSLSMLSFIHKIRR